MSVSIHLRGVAHSHGVVMAIEVGCHLTAIDSAVQLCDSRQHPASLLGGRTPASTAQLLDMSAFQMQEYKGVLACQLDCLPLGEAVHGF